MMVAAPSEQLRLDPARTARTGVPEIVYGVGKTPRQCAAAIETLLERPEAAVLASRVDQAQAEAVLERVPEARWEPTAGMVVARSAAGALRLSGRVAVDARDGADPLVADECRLVLGALGIEVTDGVGADHLDVGVCLIGLDAPVPSSLAGSRLPMIVVPTSVAGAVDPGEVAPLVAAVGRAAPGAVMVNVDGGVPAALVAARFARARPRHGLQGA